MPHTLTIHRIPWHTDGGRSLGRHVEHDSRSLEYLFDARRVPSIQTVRHREYTPVLDQGELGSCTGNSAESAAGCDPLYPVIPDSVTAKPNTTDADTDETQAVALYSAATKLDNVRGNYPPTDTGSSGLAVAKAMQNAGLVSGYQHATDVHTLAAALMVGPVLIGINWYDSFDQPDSDGTIALTRGAQVRGGHELCVLGYTAAGTSGTVNSSDMLEIKNSWSTDWGNGGYCRMSIATMDTLLGQQGDVTIPVPLSAPAPTPTPTPTPTPDQVDAQMWAACQTWAKSKGLA